VTIPDYLKTLGWTQARAAHELGVRYREFRYWYVGKKEAPRAVILALQQLIRENV
jgi:hypothetical protein